MKERCIRFFYCTIDESRFKLTFSLYDALMFVVLYLLITFEEEEEEKLYFNNLLHVHQHTSMKYMIYDTVGY